MNEYETMLISGSNLSEFSKSLTKAIQVLPDELSKRLSEIRLNYLGCYGIDGLYKRMNDRTVSQICAEYKPIQRKPIAAGERDGVKYELYDVPPADDNGAFGQK